MDRKFVAGGTYRCVLALLITTCRAIAALPLATCLTGAFLNCSAAALRFLLPSAVAASRTRSNRTLAARCAVTAANLLCHAVAASRLQLVVLVAAADTLVHCVRDAL